MTRVKNTDYILHLNDELRGGRFLLRLLEGFVGLLDLMFKCKHLLVAPIKAFGAKQFKNSSRVAY
jgi:hypothetical protein